MLSFLFILLLVAHSEFDMFKSSTTRNIRATEIHTTAHRPLDFRLECNTQFKNIFSSFATIAFFPPLTFTIRKKYTLHRRQLGTNRKCFTNVTTGIVLSDIMTAAFGYGTAVSSLKHVACPTVPLVTVTVYHEVLFVHMSVHTPQEVWGIAPCQRPEARVYLR